MELSTACAVYAVMEKLSGVDAIASWARLLLEKWSDSSQAATTTTKFTLWSNCWGSCTKLIFADCGLRPTTANISAKNNKKCYLCLQSKVLPRSPSAQSPPRPYGLP